MKNEKWKMKNEKWKMKNKKRKLEIKKLEIKVSFLFGTTVFIRYPLWPHLMTCMTVLLWTFTTAVTTKWTKILPTLQSESAKTYSLLFDTGWCYFFCRDIASLKAHLDLEKGMQFSNAKTLVARISSTAAIQADFLIIYSCITVLWIAVALKLPLQLF